MPIHAVKLVSYNNFTLYPMKTDITKHFVIIKKAKEIGFEKHNNIQYKLTIRVLLVKPSYERHLK